MSTTTTTTTKRDFVHTTRPNPHIARGRAIIKAHPEVRDLMGHYPLSAVFILLVVAAQILLGSFVSTYSWPVIIITAWLVGSIASHSLFAMMHETAHNLVFKGNTANQIMGIICNIAQAFPSSSAFKKFHLIHHSNMGEYDYDADLSDHWEAKLVGNSSIKKFLWFIMFLIVESLRPNRLKVKLFSSWVLVNILIIVGTDILIFHFLGYKILIYLMLSTIFGVGFHPVGARWIQEHYLIKEDQETYSYYGPLNKLSFNVGYHNEHHDLFRVPWVHLPKLKAMAPEFYDNLYAHKSWTKLLVRFIFDKNIDLYSRIVRPSSKVARGN